MKLYWGLNSIPELQGLPKDHQRQLWQAGHRAALRTAQGWAAYRVKMSMTGITFIMLLMLMQGGFTGVPGGYGVQIAVAALLGGLMWFIPYQIGIHVTRPFLATRPASMEQDSRDADDSSYVPPAF